MLSWPVALGVPVSTAGILPDDGRESGSLGSTTGIEFPLIFWPAVSWVSLPDLPMLPSEMTWRSTPEPSSIDSTTLPVPGSVTLSVMAGALRQRQDAIGGGALQHRGIS